MTTAPFNFKGTTVRCGGIVGTIGAQDTRNDTTWYAVDFTLNSKPMRIWRQPKALDIIAGVVKVMPVKKSQTFSLYHSYMVYASNPAITAPNFDATLSQDKTHEAPVLKPEIVDEAAQPQRDAEPFKDIQVHIRDLDKGDVLRCDPAGINREHEYERWTILWITPHVPLESREAQVGVMKGYIRDGKTEWKHAGRMDVTFKNPSTFLFRFVCGGPKFEAAKKNPALLEGTPLKTLPRWKGGQVATLPTQYPTLTDADYGVLAA